MVKLLTLEKHLKNKIYYKVKARLKSSFYFLKGMI